MTRIKQTFQIDCCERVRDLKFETECNIAHIYINKAIKRGQEISNANVAGPESGNEIVVWLMSNNNSSYKSVVWVQACEPNECGNIW